MADWEPVSSPGWQERLTFNVFRYEEPGMIKIHLYESISPTGRTMATISPSTAKGWTKRLEFFVYSSQRPGTDMIWIAYCGDPQRCIFVRGGPSDTLNGWERMFGFWVPE